MDSSPLAAPVAALLLALILSAIQVGLPVLGIQERFWFGVAVWSAILALLAYTIWILAGRLEPSTRITIVLGMAAALSAFVSPRLQARYREEHPIAPREQPSAAERATKPSAPLPSIAPTITEPPPQTTTPVEPAAAATTTQAPPPDTSRDDRIEKLLAEQNRLAAEQARIAAIPIQPRFELTIYEEGEGDSAIEVVEVSNQGPAPTDYSVHQHTFLEIRRGDTGEVRFVPTWYFMERRPTMHLEGLLTTLVAINPQASDHPTINNKNEVERIEREVKEEFGQPTNLTRDFYLSIFYTDISGIQRHQGFELGPSRAMHGPLTNWRRYDFNGNGYLALTGSGLGSEHLWKITGPLIRERWATYLTWEHFRLANEGKLQCRQSSTPRYARNARRMISLLDVRSFSPSAPALVWSPSSWTALSLAR